MASQFYKLFAVICFYFSNCKRGPPEPGEGEGGQRGLPKKVFFSMCSFFKLPFLKELLLFLSYLKTKVFGGKFATNFLHEEPKAGSKWVEF